MRPLAIRPFEDRDYQRIVEIGSQIETDPPPSLEMLQYRDRTWSPEHTKTRLVAEVDDRVVGWGQVGHLWFAPHPYRYGMRIEVEPALQRQGIGSALYERLLEVLATADAELVRTEVEATRADAMRFVESRGFTEVQRRHELRLAVSRADVPRRFDAQGIPISTFDVELKQRGERLLRELYELEVAGVEGEPRPDTDTVMSFDRFVTQEIEDPRALPDGHFLALDGERIVGLSRLSRDLSRSDLLNQGFTTVHPTYRGRGIAMALKLRTVRYATERGFSEIRTGNDATNAPMLHINEALGFARHHDLLVFEKRLEAVA
jgi:GNAT superfamily N-acetyltransferase